MHIRDQGGQGVFRLSFEILFNIPQELVDLLSDLDKRIRDRWGEPLYSHHPH
jgi:hypothetical protein